MLPPPPRGLLPEGLDGLPEQVLDLGIGQALVRRPLVDGVGAVSAEELLGAVEEQAGGDAQADHDHGAVGGRLYVLLG